MYKCKKCGKEYEVKQQLGGHSRTHNVMPKRKIKTKVEKPHICKYCFKQFDKGNQLGGHTILCRLNPKYQERVDDISTRQKRIIISSEIKDKTSKTIKEKVKNGTWHTTSKKMCKYKDIDFHSTWEVKYAKYLDENNINWRRPTESFPYVFEDKNRRYTPDFYLMDEDLYVEVKGYETPKDRAKWKYFPLKLKVLKFTEFKKMGLIS